MADEAGSGAASPLARRLRWLQDRLWSITIVVLVGIGVLIAIGYTISLRLDDARSAQTDNTTWLVAQTEVELLKLDIVLGATRPQAALTPLREAVDIYLSRIATVDSYMARAPVLGVLQGGDDWQRVLEGSERLRRLIDVPDALLAMNLPAARHETAALRRPMRQFALQALALQIEAATRSRESLADLLTGSALVGITLILLLLGTAWMLRSLGDRLRLRHAEAARARSNLESLLAATGDGVIVIGPGGHVRGVNAAATRLLGRPDSAVIGQPVARLLALPAGGLREGALDPAGVGSDAPDERRVEVGVLLPDGTERPTELVIAAGQDTDGAPLRFLFLQDVSEQRRHETSLRAARDAAVQAAEAKTRFLAMMSHEMRTPLNGVIAALDILMRTARPNRKQQRFLEIAERAAASALDQVNDVLELARLGDDSVLEAATDFDMAALLRDLAEEMAPLAARHGNSITVEAPDLAGVWLHGPRRSLKRVLTNLVGNAAKFTQNGAITLRAGLAGGARDQMLTVEVVDTGAGIAADRLETIFDPFERLETGYDRATEGTGLGLGIARRMVERMGGTLGVSSAPGQGSVFRFAVPLPPGTPVAPGDRAPLTDEGELPAQEILIVEDNPTNRLVLREMLRHLGQNVTEAADGAEAVALARLYPFDLILMDISMPGMDGLTATRAIRAGGASGQARIVALTAHGLPEELERFRAEGLTEILAKPLTLAGLRPVIAGQAVQNGTAAAGQDMDARVIADLRALLPLAQRRALIDRLHQEGAAALHDGGQSPEAQAEQIHRLRGSAAMAGLVAPLAGLERLEVALRAGTRPDAALAEMRGLWARALAELPAHLLPESAVPAGDWC